MPTFNCYKNKPGYYIRAWTPETGNINYKIRREGNPIVEDYGLHHGEEISWDTINSLKALGLIYTEESGTIATDEFEPDPDHVSETSLSSREAENLLEVIQAHQNVSADNLAQIAEILGIDPPTSEIERLQSSLETELEDVIARLEVPIEHTLESYDTLLINIKDIRDDVENGLFGIYVIFIGEDDRDDLQMVVHWVFVCQIHGIERWEVASNNTESWEQKGEMIRQKGILLPILAEALSDIGINPGDSTGTPIAPFVEFGETGV